MYNLVGIDGNAFSIMGYVSNAMKEQHFTKSEISDYKSKAMTSDYYNLLNVSVDYINRCNARVKSASIGDVFSSED